jgi:uncharacterized protein YjlB
MPLFEKLKKSFETVTGYARPSRRDIDAAVRPRKPSTFRFKDDGVIPNNPGLPLILYRTPLHLGGTADPAAMFEELFGSNKWGESWRNGIYDFVHYHSQNHEVLGIARGRGRVRFGGDGGRMIEINAGDVVILPAGTGHQCVQSSSDLLVVGAYPSGGTYDECRGTAEEHDRALARISHVPVPAKDPVYGRHGPLRRLWQKPDHRSHRTTARER